MKTKSKRTIPWWFFSWLGLICLAAIAIPVLEYESAEAGWRYANRYLVRIGLPLFLLSFIASSLHRLKPSKFSRLLMKNRRYLGLGFAMTHFTHLFAIVVFFSVSDEAVDTLTLIGGGATYVLIGLMAATSNNRSVKKLGKYWRYLHKAGAYSIWIVFTVSYLGRLTEQGLDNGFTLIFAALVIAQLVRIWAFWKKRARSQVGATA